uniref:Glycoprotease 1 n=1 Tax=Oryza rufipogon TaxID=4529 RepID=A0A0E0RHC6_ORYRU
MAATLLPTLSPPASRAAAALLLRRAPPFPSPLPAPLLRRLLAPAPSPPLRSSPTFRSLATMPSAAAAADLLMLGIETSCDDTAAAVVRGDGEILSQVVSSQEDLLVRWGGVAPKMAEEAHSLAIDQVVQKALDDANVSENDLSAVAVTVGPGLSLCLRVGVHKARKIAKSFRLPIVGVHHMEAHALVSRLVNKDLDFPFLALLISGGHNLLVLAHGLGQYVQLGTTIDDAIGEAYDKSARWLGLDMRKGGGPALEQLALEGDPNAVKFSVPMRQHKDCNFSYAGLKTQRVAVLHLEERCQRAVEWALKMEPSIKYFVVSGGVASNQYVRTHLNQIAEKNGLQLVVMIAWTGIEHFIAGRFDDPPAVDEPDDMQYDLRPRWPLGEEYSEGRSASRSMKTARVHPSLTSMIQGSVH